MRAIFRGRAVARQSFALPDWLGERVFGAVPFHKGAGHKYIARVPSKRPGRKWEYIYHAAAGRGVAHEADFEEGARFRVTDAGKGGHFHVTGTDGDKVHLRHDESGKTATMTRRELATMLHNEHIEAIQGREARIRRDLDTAHRSGASERQKARIESELAQHKAKFAHVAPQTKTAPDTEGPARVPSEPAFRALVDKLTGHKEKGARQLGEAIDKLGADGFAERIRAGKMAPSMMTGTTFRRVMGQTAEAWLDAATKAGATPSKMSAAAQEQALRDRLAGKQTEPERKRAAPDQITADEQQQREEAARKSAEKRRRTAPPVPDKSAQATSASPGFHERVGGEVKGARRHMEPSFIEGLESIEGLDEGELQNAIQRDVLFPRPSMETLRDSGYSPGAAKLVHWLHKNIAKHPVRLLGGGHQEAVFDANSRARYLSAIRVVQKTLGRVRSVKDVRAAVEELSDYFIGSKYIGDFKSATEASNALSDHLDAIDDGSSEFRSLKSALLWRQYNENRVAKSSYPVFGPSSLAEYRERIQDAAVLGADFHAFVRTKGGSSTFWKAIRDAEAVDRKGWDAAEQGGAARKQPTQKERRSRFEWTIERTGLVERVGGTRTETVPNEGALQRDFGLATVDFGNWVSKKRGDSDASEHLLSCHNALYDLADMLGMEPAGVGLGSLSRDTGDRYSLSIAFGARGAGKASAHYEPFSKHEDGRFAPVINLTKFRGGGSLAHEWGHFLDNLLALAHRPDRSSQWSMSANNKPPFVSEDPDGFDLPPQIKAAAKELATALFGTKGAPTTYLRHAEGLSGAYDSEGKRSNQRNKRKSAYTGVAEPYWERRREMFARAFESYVEDKLHANRRRNTYLVSGTRAKYLTGSVLPEDFKAARDVVESNPDVVKAKNAYTEAVERYRQSYPRTSAYPKAGTPEREAMLAAQAEVYKLHTALQSERDRAMSNVTLHHCQPFPQGEERKRINEAFDKFVASIREGNALEKSLRALAQLPKPTAGQKDAGNYPKHHIRFAGLDVAIENPKGSERRGVGPDGTPWATTMQNHYGYVKRSRGFDGDHLDVYLGPNESAPTVYVVHQVDPSTGLYDEDKCMVGFDSQEEAKRAYLAHYDSPRFFGDVSAVPLDEFKRRIGLSFVSGGELVPGTNDRLSQRAAVFRGRAVMRRTAA